MKIADAAIATIVRKILKSWNGEHNRYGDDSQGSIAKEINKHLAGLVDARAFTLDFLSGLSTVDQEEIAQLLTAAIEDVDNDHWVGFPMTLLDVDEEFHSFSTDTSKNYMTIGLDIFEYDLADPKFSEPGARQRGFIELSNRLAVHEPDAEGVLKIQRLEDDREWVSNTLELPQATTLLCIKVRGFVGRWYKCPIFQSRYEALIKTVLLLGQWRDVGDYGPVDMFRGDLRGSGISTPMGHPDHRFTVFFDPAQASDFKEGPTIDSEISFALSNHGFCNWNFTVDEESDQVVDVGDIANSKKEFFRMHSVGLDRLIDSYENYLDLINAAQWCFDACRLSGREPVKALLFLGIAWDALLGSKGGSANITSTLGDRLAYLISQTREEREEILGDFKRFYQVRSKVVHGRLAWLDESETEAFEWGLRAFKKAFEKELELI